MARDDNPWLENLPPWSDTEERLWDDLATENNALLNDEILQVLYHEAFYDFDLSKEQRKQIRKHLADYLEDRYDLVWDDIFDWAAWREAYAKSA